MVCGAQYAGMVDRQSLLDTGKSAGSSIAGTLSSVAGTVSETAKSGGRRAASATREGLQRSYEELTDDNVTDQDRARLGRAREEAITEARQEARREYREEYQENIADEAYDRELQRLRRQQGTPQATRQAQPTTASRGMGMFGIPQQQPSASDGGRDEQPQAPQPTMASLFGMGQPSQQSDRDDAARDPLFGLQL